MMGKDSVKKFFEQIKKDHDELERYNETLIESGSYLLTDPMMMGEGFPVVATLPENPEESILEEIIETDEKSDKEQVKEKERSLNHGEKKETLVKLFSGMMDDFVTNVIHDGKSEETRLGEKRKKLFKKLAELAVDDGYDLTADDLEYYVGEEIREILKKDPKASPGQIIRTLIDKLSK
ncbi:hypothetical protein [Eubacterium aggregans]|nr:hypothetical protein [Eubacterium aggregans]MDD4690896.1 hypothetical protein [Eubacterium aggregans]